MTFIASGTCRELRHGYWLEDVRAHCHACFRRNCREDPDVLEERIGDGAAGTVIKARDEQINRSVAIKVFQGENKIERAKYEWSMYARINRNGGQPNVQ